MSGLMFVPPKVSSDKEKRTQMHKAIREHFPQLESKTEDGENPGEKVISVQAVDSGKTNKHGKFCLQSYYTT